MADWPTLVPPLLRGFLEAGIIGMLAWDVAGSVTDANDEFLRIVGYSRDDLEAGRLYWRELTPAEYRHKDEQALAELRATGRCTPFEKEYVRKDGTRVPVLIGGGMVDAARSRGVAFVLDLSVRKEAAQAQQALRESELRYRLIAEAANDAIWDWNMVTNQVTWNDGVHALFGYAEDQVGPTADWWKAQIHPEDLHRVSSGIHAALDGGADVWQDEYRFRRADGSYADVFDRGRILREDGRPTRMVGAMVDLTERRRTEEAVRVSESRLRLAMDAARLGVWEVDLTNGHVTWDGQLLGWGAGGKPDFHAAFSGVHDEDREQMRAAFERTVAGGTDFQSEFRVVSPAGVVRWHAALGKRITDATGHPVKVVGIATDITERKEMERRLHDSEEQVRQALKMEAVGRLAGGVAHDFNNLLTIINGFSDTLIAQLPPNSQARELAHEIAEAGRRAATLTRQLLAFSRKQVLEPKVLNLNTIVADTIKMLRRLIGEDVELHTALARELPCVKADPGQLAQVLVNLAVNARDAMPQGGRLTIQTTRVDLATDNDAEGVPAGHYVRLSVRDTGGGMDHATMLRVFEPFFTTKGEGKGTGLGLATVYGIVTQSGGHITVDSARGAGTTFTIYLPVVAGLAATEDVDRAVAATVAGGETILLAEDEPALRRLARRVLQTHGYTVLEATDGENALEIAERHGNTIHLLLTDVVMPAMSGREVAERLLVQRPGLKVLYLSGYTDDDILRHGVLNAEAEFLSKPFTPAALVARVREVLKN